MQIAKHSYIQLIQQQSGLHLMMNKHTVGSSGVTDYFDTRFWPKVQIYLCCTEPWTCTYPLRSWFIVHDYLFLCSFLLQKYMKIKTKKKSTIVW